MASTSINEKIQEALKEGYSMDQIRGFLSKTDNEEARNYLKATEAAQAQAAANANKFELTQYPEVPAIELFGGPVGIALGAGAAGLALGYGATKLKDRIFKPQTSAPQVPEVPTPAPVATAPTPTLSRAEQFYGVAAATPEEKMLLDRSYQAMLDKQAMAAARQAVVPPTSPTIPVFTQAPVAPSATPVVPAATTIAPGATPMAPAPAAPMPTTFAGATVAEPPVAAPAAPAEATKPAKAAKPPKTAIPGIAPPEGLTAPQRSAFNYIVKSQKELGIKDPAQYVEFVKQVFGGQMPEMGPKGGAPVGFREKMGELKGSEMMPLSKPERDALRAKGIEIPSSQKGGATVPQMLNLLGNTLGAIGLAQAYNRGQQTGDWSDFGLGVVGQTLANVAPRAATPFALMSPGGLNVGEAEELARRRRMGPTID